MKDYVFVRENLENTMTALGSFSGVPNLQIMAAERWQPVSQAHVARLAGPKCVGVTVSPWLIPFLQPARIKSLEGMLCQPAPCSEKLF